MPSTCISPVNIRDQWVGLNAGAQEVELWPHRTPLPSPHSPQQARISLVCVHITRRALKASSMRASQSYSRLCVCKSTWTCHAPLWVLPNRILGKAPHDLAWPIMLRRWAANCGRACACKKYIICHSSGGVATQIFLMCRLLTQQESRGFLSAGFTIHGKIGHRGLVILYCTR